MPLKHGNKIIRCEAREGRFAEVRVTGYVILRSNISIRKIAAPSAGDEDLLPDPFSMVNDQDRAAAPSRPYGAHKARCPGAGDNTVFFHYIDNIRQSLAASHNK